MALVTSQIIMPLSVLHFCRLGLCGRWGLVVAHAIGDLSLAFYICMPVLGATQRPHLRIRADCPTSAAPIQAA